MDDSTRKAKAFVRPMMIFKIIVLTDTRTHTRCCIHQPFTAGSLSPHTLEKSLSLTSTQLVNNHTVVVAAAANNRYEEYATTMMRRTVIFVHMIVDSHRYYHRNRHRHS
jgi:hypothetical protein